MKLHPVRQWSGWFGMVVAVGLLTANGCGRASSGTGGYRVAVIPKGTSHQFWKSVHFGAQQAANELGNVEIIWIGPQTEGDIAQQKRVVQNMITMRVSGICLAPNHSESLVGEVQEAIDAGVPVIVFDSGLGQGPQIVSYVATDNYRGGELAADRMAEVLGGKGNVILLRYNQGSESTEQREQGFLDRLAKRHTGIRVLSSDQHAGITTKDALDKATQLLGKYREQVDGIFAVCEPNCNGTLAALEQTGLAGKVKFIAFDPSESLIAGLAAGKVHGIVLQDPVHMGYTSVKTLVAHLQGQAVEKRVSTGEYVATAENMNSELFQRLLKPKLAE